MGFGQMAFLGSGETSPSGGQVFEALAGRLPTPLRVSILETPAGFELNSANVAGRVADYMRTRLQNYRPVIDLVPARKRGTPFGPDNLEILTPLKTAHLIFLGPGSPTYAVRQLKDSLAWNLVQARERVGAALALASAAVIAAGSLALPVYEIYKVGEEPTWKGGLGLLEPFGLKVVFIPHWNNQEGGAELDTSHCFMGEARFSILLRQLPADITVVGIDEATGVVLDVEAGQVRVIGRGGIHLVARSGQQDYGPGETFAMTQLGSIRLPEPQEGIPGWAWVSAQEVLHQAAPPPIPGEIQRMLADRQAARQRQDWPAADRLRSEIAGMGWRVVDTAEGQRLEPLE